jgi:DNA-binding transcriptional regulator YiaG
MSKINKNMNLSMDSCAICGEEVVLTVLKELKRSGNWDKPAVTLQDVEAYQCQVCHEIYFNPTQMKLMEKKTIDAERQSLGLLSAGEIKEIVQRVGLPKLRLEEILGINPRSLTRWINNHSLQSKQADTLLRFIRHNPKTVFDIASERHVPTKVKAGRKVVSG